jgi:Cys-rich protein (TIGR01571 family)
MGAASHQRHTQATDAPALHTASRSLEADSEPSVSCPPNYKPDPRMIGTHPTDSAGWSDSITPEDARYLRKHAAESAPPPRGPGLLPVKPRRELQPQPEAINIVPDENPLSLQSPNRHHNMVAASDSAVDSHLPGQAIHANQYMKGGTWKYGLCDCGDIGVCCTGVWCPCIIYGKTQYRLSQRSERKDPINMLGYSTFNGSCAAFAVLCGCNVILAAIQHSRVRKAYDIPGGVGTDVVRACCCCCCTLSQDEKEIKHRENQARKLSGSAAAMQYMSPQGMSFSAPPK